MKWFVSAFFALALYCTPVPASAALEARPFEISEAYAYATGELQKSGAVFLQILTTVAEPDRLLSASTDVAARAELHTHSKVDGVLQMRKLDTIYIPGGEGLVLEPMGYHIMLFGLKRQLKAGETFPLTLQLENAGALEAMVQVVPPGQAPGQMQVAPQGQDRVSDDPGHEDHSAHGSHH